MKVIFGDQLLKASLLYNRGLYMLNSISCPTEFRCGSRGFKGTHVDPFYYRAQECDNKSGKTEWTVKRRPWKLVLIAPMRGCTKQDLLGAEKELHGIARKLADDTHLRQGKTSNQGSGHDPVGYTAKNVAPPSPSPPCEPPQSPLVESAAHWNVG
jgi:hypothetical protein